MFYPKSARGSRHVKYKICAPDSSSVGHAGRAPYQVTRGVPTGRCLFEGLAACSGMEAKDAATSRRALRCDSFHTRWYDLRHGWVGVPQTASVGGSNGGCRTRCLVPCAGPAFEPVRTGSHGAGPQGAPRPVSPRRPPRRPTENGLTGLTP